MLNNQCISPDTDPERTVIPKPTRKTQKNRIKVYLDLIFFMFRAGIS